MPRNDQAQDEPGKPTSLPERAPQETTLSAQQWILQALNNLQTDVRGLRNDIAALSQRVGKLEGWIKWVGGFLTAFSVIAALIFVLTRLGVVISFSMKQ